MLVVATVTAWSVCIFQWFTYLGTRTQFEPGTYFEVRSYKLSLIEHPSQGSRRECKIMSTEIRVIRNGEEFIRLTEKLYQYIEDDRNRIRQYYLAKGRPIPDRISFEELDLRDHMTEMLSVQKTLHHGFYHNINDRAASKARSVAIAGICEFIKNDYLGRFWDSYKQLIDRGGDNTVYNWIWEKGFRDEGIELIHSRFSGRREFVQSLILESGIPKRRISDIIYFFVVYYRYLRKYEDIEDLVIRLAEDTIILPVLSSSERADLMHICKNAIDYSHAFARVIEKLKAVFDFIEKSGEIVSQNIRDHTDLIYEKTGIHPLEILRDEEQLEQLYRRLLGFLTPPRLRRILTSLPPATSVMRPSGRSISAGEYRFIQYGEHVIGSVHFTCVPVYGLDPEKLDRLPYNELIDVGGGVLFKSTGKLKVTIDGFERYDVTRWFYIKKMGSPMPEGAVFFSEIPEATSLVIRDEKGEVLAERNPETGFFFIISLGYLGCHEEHRHGLKIDINRFRLHDSSLANREIFFVAGENEEGALTSFIDRNGTAGLDGCDMEIANPYPGEVIVRSIDCNTNKELIVNAKPVEQSIKMDSVMLFTPVHQWQISAVKKGRSNGFGYRHLTLFMSDDIPLDAVKLDNLQITGESKCGGYRALSLKWENRRLPSSIEVSFNGAGWHWLFDDYADYTVNIYNVLENNYRGIRFGPKEGRRPEDFNLVLTPAPEAEAGKSLLWNVVINDSMPVVTKFESGPAGLSTSCCLEFKSEEFSKLIKTALEKFPSGITKVEISLGKKDHILTSDRICLIPDLELEMKEVFREGEVIEADVIYGNNSIHLDLSDNAGNNNASIELIQGEDGKWQLNHRKYSSKIVIREAGIRWDARVTPIVTGCRLISKEGKQEMLRSLLKRELCNYGVFIIHDVLEVPSVSVNGRGIAVTHIEGSGISTLHLDNLGRLKKTKNQVIIQTKYSRWNFDILYTLTVENPVINEQFINGMVFGEIGLSGPENSGVAFEVYEEEVKDANKRGEITLMCMEVDFQTQFFDIQLQSPPVAERKYVVRLLLLPDILDRRNAKEYGKLWTVTCQPAGVKGPDDRGFDIIIETVRHEIEKGRYFRVKQLLAVVNGMTLDESQKIMLRNLANRIEFRLCGKKIESIIRQARGSLRKGYDI